MYSVKFINQILLSILRVLLFLPLLNPIQKNVDYLEDNQYIENNKQNIQSPTQNWQEINPIGLGALSCLLGKIIYTQRNICTVFCDVYKSIIVDHPFCTSSSTVEANANNKKLEKLR